MRSFLAHFCGLAAGRRAHRLGFVWLLLGLLAPRLAQATHIRAGDIQSRVDATNPNRIYFTLTLYLNSQSPVDQTTATLFFGDGTVATSPRASRTNVSAATNISTYNFDHIFPAGGSYRISFIEENRNDGILNINGGNSVNISFYIQSEIIINPAYLSNRSPVLLAPAIDRATLFQPYLHNPAGFDADGDSLAYRLIPCQQVVGGIPAVTANNNVPRPIDVPGFVLPNNSIITGGTVPRQVAYSGNPIGRPGDPAIFQQDVNTGQITWNAPARAGLYNVAFVVEEWRRTASGIRRIGSVVRDMQIEVLASTNVPPVLTVPDVCVVAGRNLTFNVSAADGTGPGPDGAPTAVTLSAFGGMLPPDGRLQPQGSFRQNNTGTSVTGTFSWTPSCANVSDLPYVVVFRAVDAGNPPLADIRPINIRVIGPPPQNLRAVPGVSAAGPVGLLSWDSYACQNASQILIFRKENPSTWNPGACETGIPASAGYVQVGSVPATATTFADNNSGRGLTRGRTYCYRIYAVYPLPAGGASIASNESCLTLSGRSSALTNVDVNTTDPNTGQITVKWTQPRPDVPGSTFGAPFGYRLSRGVGLNPATFTPVATITNLSDTTYVDRGLNTTALQYTYQLVFFNTAATPTGPQERTETAPPASSVRTSLVPDGLARTVTVNFSYQVPWDNTQAPARVFRRDPGSTTFNQVGTVTPGATSGTFVDRDPALQRDQDYCYYVQTNGQYPTFSWLRNLLNNSQQACTRLVTTPCTPVLSVQPLNCDSLAALPSFDPTKATYSNALRWTVGATPAGCSTGAAYYRIFRGEAEAGPFALLDSTAQLSYLDRRLGRPGYCYQVQAVASNGQRSARSNVACQSECTFFVLPNVFTPNGDGINDTFRPKNSSLITRTNIQIFNRWGRKVYESDRFPYIDWDGGGRAGESTTSGLVSGGIYYYLATVTFGDRAQTTRTFKGWVEIIR